MRNTSETLEQSNQDFLDLAFVDADCRANQAFYKLTKRVEAHTGPLARPTPSISRRDVSKDISSPQLTTFLDYEGDVDYRTYDLENFLQEHQPRFARIHAVLGACSTSRFSSWLRDYKTRPLLHDITPMEETRAPVIDLDTYRRKKAVVIGKAVAGAVASVTLLATAAGFFSNNSEPTKSTQNIVGTEIAYVDPTVPAEAVPRTTMPVINLTEIVAQAQAALDAKKNETIKTKSYNSSVSIEEVKKIIRDAANRWGISEQYALAIADCESDFIATAIGTGDKDNEKYGKPLGVFQHRERLWAARAARYGHKGASIFNPYAQANVTMQMLNAGDRDLWEC